jgi:hypothetical protein
MDTETLKGSLLSALWPKHTTVTVEGRDGPVELIVRRPPPVELLNLVQSEEGDALKDDTDQMAQAKAALRFQARVVARTIFLPNAVRPLFTEEEVLLWPHMKDVAEHCMAAILPPGTAVERAKGN